MSKRKCFSCPICGKRFRASHGVPQHAWDVHQEIGVKARFNEPQKSEPSIADRMIEAQLQEAMGEPVEDDWLLDSL